MTSPALSTNRAVVLEGACITPIDVEIVVPVYNEAECLEASIDRLHAYLACHFPFTWRITIADNASTDGTWAIAQRLAVALPNVEAMHLDRKGRGLALRTAWLASSARVVAYTDVDLSTDLDALLPLVAPLVSGHSDIAIGSRLAPGAAVARAPKRELISRSYNLLLRVIFANRFRDAQCGFKAVRSDVVQRLVPAIEDNEWFFDTELLLLAEHNGLRVHEVPVDWVDDPHSSVHVVDTAIGDLLGALRMARRFATGHGGIDLGEVERSPLADDFGRRIVSFTLIGTLSTIVSLSIFCMLRSRLGSIGANAIAVTIPLVANTWANRRFTVGQRPGAAHWRQAVALYVLSIAAASLALVAVASLGGGFAWEVTVLLATWTGAAVARFTWLNS